MKKKNVAVIGAGPMGLMVAYELLKKGHQVTLYEKDDRIGGMTASFDFKGLEIERFYHFVCATDNPTFDLMKELGIYDKLKWKVTKMGFFYDGKLYKWGDPLSLLKFPKLNILEKFRYGLHVMYCKGIKDWRKLDKVACTPWLKKWVGERAYNILWKFLFSLKFDQYENDLSAAWLGTRIQRVGKSRKSLFEEQMGYIERGSATLLTAMQIAIEKLGGQIKLKANITEVCADNNQITGVRIDEEMFTHDKVISTIPLPYVSRVVPTLDSATKEKIKAIKNVGVVCVLFKLKNAFTENFWMNTNDPRIGIPGLIEYTNLQEYDNHVIYAPYYMSQQHEKFNWSDQQFVIEVTDYLKMIRPDFDANDILDTYVARYQFAQTVCTPNFYDKLPPMKSTIKNFYMADTAYYYPEDRSISESVALGKTLAKLAVED